MPEMINQTLRDQDVLIGGITPSTGSSGRMLDQIMLRSIQELQLGIGPGSNLLRLVGIRAFEGFYFNSSISYFLDDGKVVDDGILHTLAEIYDLLTWPECWNGYNACAPKYEAVQYAIYWIILFCQEVVDLRLNWIGPNVTASGEGEVVFEWRHGIKNLTIYIGSQGVEYMKDWGTDVSTEMEDGYANSLNVRRALWLWLMS